MAGPSTRNAIAIERLFNKLKQFRRVATGYDKLLDDFLGFVTIAAIAIAIKWVSINAPWYKSSPQPRADYLRSTERGLRQLNQPGLDERLTNLFEVSLRYRGAHRRARA